MKAGVECLPGVGGLVISTRKVVEDTPCHSWYETKVIAVELLITRRPSVPVEVVPLFCVSLA